MMSELKRRRLLRKGQLIVADKGFYSASNYLIGINKYKMVLSKMLLIFFVSFDSSVFCEF